jgi:hypothetical protein
MKLNPLSLRVWAIAFALFGATEAYPQDMPEAEPWNWSDEYVHAAVDQVRAGRDLNPASWPNGARVAVLLSFDVDNETTQGLRTGEISIGPLSRSPRSKPI